MNNIRLAVSFNEDDKVLDTFEVANLVTSLGAHHDPDGLILRTFDNLCAHMRIRLVQKLEQPK